MPTSGRSRPTIREASRTSPRVRSSAARISWVVSPSFTYERIVGSGDAWFIRGKARYPDGSTWHVASIYLLRDGLILKEITYWAEPFESPAWRAEWVERIPAG